MRKITDKFSVGTFYKIPDQYSLNCQVIENQMEKESLRNCHSQEEPKET